MSVSILDNGISAGLFVKHATAATPFIVGAAMKIAYDLMLYAAFRRLRRPRRGEADCLTAPLSGA